MADYREAYEEASRELGEIACKTVREIVGSGKTIYLAGSGGIMGGKSLRRALDSSSWDIRSSPIDYNIRRPGYPGGCGEWPVDSFSLHGKLFLHEQDWRTIANPTQFEDQDFGNGRVPTVAALRNGMLRESGLMISHCQGTHILDMYNGTYALPELMTCVREASRLFEAASRISGRPQADVALFIGEDSFLYLSETVEARRYRTRALRRHAPEWNLSGVPYHIYAQHDLTHQDLPDYKVYVFVNPESMDDNVRRAVDALKRDGRVLVFLHAPGMIGSANPSLEIGQITGIQTTLVPGVSTLAAAWERESHPLLDNLHGRFGDRPYPYPDANCPAKGWAFEIQEPEAVVLARFCDSV